MLFKIWESNFPEENIQVLIINLFPWCSYLKTFTFNLVILVNEKIVKKSLTCMSGLVLNIGYYKKTFHKTDFKEVLP